AEEPIEKKFNITADNAPAKDFFLELVSGTNINIIIHPEVQGHISLALKNSTIIEALEAVQKIHGFGFEISNNNIKIFPVTLQTKVFKLNYLDLTRSGNSGTNINFSGISSSSSQSNSTNNNSSNNNNNNNNNNSSSNNNNTNSNGSNVMTYNSTNVWDQLLTTIQSIIGINQESTTGSNQNLNQSMGTNNNSNYGLNTIKKNFNSLLKIGNNKNSSNNSMDAQSKRVAVSPTTGMIIVTAYPNELEKVAQFLEDAENSLNRQVMLEAKVLEIDLKDGYRTGINWSLLNEHMKISQIIGGSASGSEEDLSSDTKVNSYGTNASKNINLNVGNQHLAPDINTTLNSFGGLFTLGLNYRKLATFVELLSAQGNVQVLSSPRITTSNNQKALIKVGNDSYYITGFTPSTTTTNTGGTTTNQPSVSLSPLFSGIALDVTPQIGDDEITLHIHPTISSITTSPTNIPGNTGENAVNLAVNSIRESDSIVRAKNGQLIIIGGLMQDKTAEIVTGIPILKDLPILVNIF
ncbi:MAG: type II secretion system protein GspD, partial [Gammaproteobacteria bacterium]